MCGYSIEASAVRTKGRRKSVAEVLIITYLTHPQKCRTRFACEDPKSKKMNLNKCPKCDTSISKVNAEPVEIVVSRADRYRGLSYSCPNCQSVLSIQMNPLTLKDDTLGALQTNWEQLAESLETNLSQRIVAEMERMLERPS